MYVLNPRLAADIFDNEYIIANLDTGLYYSAQGLIVSIIKGLPFQDINIQIQAFSKAFPDQASIVEEELQRVFEELIKENIVLKRDKFATQPSSVCIPPADYSQSKLNRFADMQDLLLLDPIHEVDEDGWNVKEEPKEN